MKQFASYSLIGVLNTLCHWLVYALLLPLTGSQSSANLLAFLAAATLSFALNARWTFRKMPRRSRYVLWLAAMGTLSFGTGALIERLDGHPVLTPVLTSAVSLLLGFSVARLLVFRNKPSL